MSKKKQNKNAEESSPLGDLGDLVKKLVSSPDQAIQKITSTTSELKQSLNAEIKKYLDKIDPSKEIEKILEKYDFEINATVRLKKKDQKSSKENGKSKSKA